MSRSVGIITIQGDNFGATLQAVALNKKLNSLGYEAKNLNYNDKKRVTAGMSAVRKAKYVIWNKFIARIIAGNARKNKFEQFRNKNLLITQEKWNSYGELKNKPPKFDIYMSGSDQIWNPDVIKYDYNYLLEFAPDGSKKIAYASSFGKSSIYENKKEIYKNLLGKYEFIGVREESGKSLLKNNFDIESEVVLDPTLLLTKEEWNNVADCTDKEEKDYVLCYYMPGDKIVCDAISVIANSLAEENDLHVINLGMKEYYKFKRNIDCRINAGPDDFVRLFMNAKYVVTNSFHGTAFATNFGKKVYVPINSSLDDNKARHTRMTDYLKMIGLKDAIIPVDGLGEIKYKQIVFDYEKVNKILMQKRNNSIEFIKKSIG